MTVAELIAHLQQLPQDLPVVSTREEHDGSYGGPANECVLDLEGSQLVRIGARCDWYDGGKEYESIASDSVGWLAKNNRADRDGLALLLW